MIDTIGRLKKRMRLSREDPGHVAVSHPTKKVTRGRLRTSRMLPKGHRKLPVKQLHRLIFISVNGTPSQRKEVRDVFKKLREV